MRVIRVLWLVIPVVLIALMASCKYDDVIPVTPDPGIPVSFSEDVIPIFNASCNVSGCHNGSGPAPNLLPAAAYDALWDGGYIDTIAPDNSELYLWMSGLRGLPMPIQGSNATYNATVLSWITQGALDN